jgi:CheY-like chemotaxis protein
LLWRQRAQPSATLDKRSNCREDVTFRIDSVKTTASLAKKPSISTGADGSFCVKIGNFGVALVDRLFNNYGMNEDFETNSSGSSASRILLCDDSPVERMALAHFLRRSGYRVDEVADGASALEHLKNREVDIMLLDLQMPGVDGFDVLSYLQQNRRGLPVILLSGMPVDEIQQNIHGLPSHALPPLFLKPFDLDSLLSLVEMQLRGELDHLTDDARDPDSAAGV